MPWPTFLTWPTSPLHKQGLKEALATRDAARDTLELLVLDNFFSQDLHVGGSVINLWTKDEQLNGRICTRSFSCATLS